MESLDFVGTVQFESAAEDLGWQMNRTDAVVDADVELASQIMEFVLEFRRSHVSTSHCDTSCVHCQAPHLGKVVDAIKQGAPVTFVLPAFPGKSPNLAKVLGVLPDMAEQLALQFLDQLAEKIKAVYSPGAHIVLCSDGRVFSDVVGMKEADVTSYQRALSRMIEDLNLKNISTFNLDEWCDGEDFAQARLDLMEQFGASLEALRGKVQRGANPTASYEEVEANRMYCGITRFLVEDATFPGQTKSRTAVQKECKARAYEVILKSNAWSELIAIQFPEAVRLSIHPQACGAKKLGIRLVGTDSWMTPWHGVAVQTESGFTLMKRNVAESLGAKLVLGSEGRPSHFELTKSQALELSVREVEA